MKAEKVETMTCIEASKILGISPMCIKFAILSGSIPIGMVSRSEHSLQDRTIIIKARLEKWIKGELKNREPQYGIPYVQKLISDVAKGLDGSMVFFISDNERGRMPPAVIVKNSNLNGKVDLFMVDRFKKWVRGKW